MVMTKHGMRLQRKLFLLRVVGTKVIPLEIVKIEIAPIFLMLVADLDYEHFPNYCILP